ncbi:MAG: hypothetical protein Q9202_005757 [Teloschistes flavicans]
MSSPRKRAQSVTRYATRSQSPQKVDITEAKKDMPKRQPSIHSEAFESEHIIDAGNPYSKATEGARKARTEKTAIDEKLRKYHRFLREENRHYEPGSEERYNEIRAFIANLSGSKAMLDARVYNDIKAILRAHSEKRMQQDEQEAAATTKRKSSSSSSGRSTTASTKAASRIFSPDLAYDDAIESPQTTVTTPTGSPVKRKSVTFEQQEEEEGADEYLNPDYDDDDDDADLLEFAPSLLAAAEKKAALGTADGTFPDEETEHEPSTPKAPRTTTRHAGSKRHLSDAVDLDTAHKRRRRGAHVPASTVSRAEELSSVKKAAAAGEPRGRYQRAVKRQREEGVVPSVELDDDEDRGVMGVVGEKRRSARGKAGRPRKSDTGKAGARPGSGMLMPDAIREFEAGVEDRGGVEMGEVGEGEVRFWPGDPEFLFGETKFLEALKSRQIEEDLAGGEFHG